MKIITVILPSVGKTLPNQKYIFIAQEEEQEEQ